MQEELNILKGELIELEEQLVKIDAAIANCELGIRKIINSFYVSGFWKRPKRSKNIKRI